LNCSCLSPDLIHEKGGQGNKMAVKFCEVVLPDFAEMKELFSNSKDAQVSNFGPLYWQFHDRLISYLAISEDKDLSIVSSGTTALMTAFHSLGTKSTLVPSYTFAATQQAATLQGIKTIVADVELATGTFSLDTLEKHKEEVDTVTAVCPLSSIPIDKLIDISIWCKKNNKKLVIDGAATFGTLGPHFNLGDAYCLSFHGTKNLPIGEGGCVIYNKGLDSSIRQYINFGLGKNKKIQGPGCNGKVSDYTCAIGLSLMDKIIPYFIARQKNVALYKELCSEVHTLSTIKNTVYSCLPIYLPYEIEAKRKVLTLREEGIEALQYYYPLDDSNNSTFLYTHSICLPCHSQVTTDDIHRIAEIINA